MRVLIVSNLDSKKPFGQFGRPFYLGRGMAEDGFEVAHVGIDCSRVRYGPAWSTGAQSLRKIGRATAVARRAFRPDVIYAHQNLPGVAALLTSGGVPVAADFHSLPSVEWAQLAKAAPTATALRHRLAWLRAAAAERALASRAEGIVSAGPGLADEIVARYHPEHPPHVVPNGFDHVMFEAPRAPVAPFDGEPAAAHALAILPAASSASNRRALEFLGEIARELDKRVPDLALHVVGTDDGPQAGVLRYHGLQQVGAWLDHADVCLLPYPSDAMHFGGSKYKLMEYLARGRRIVSTPEGTRGLEEVGDWDAVTVVPYEPAAFAEGVARAIQPDAPSLEEKRSEVSRYRWDVLARELARGLQEIAARAS
ncbi:MAG TPA: glycosyltransferase [Thermoleophilaceae bacterium]|nr:glycosyltransferase [Thermoleophilaceae bacterium]